jgi:hypothetical protein
MMKFYIGIGEALDEPPLTIVSSSIVSKALAAVCRFNTKYDILGEIGRNKVPVNARIGDSGLPVASTGRIVQRS